MTHRRAVLISVVASLSLISGARYALSQAEQDATAAVQRPAGPATQLPSRPMTLTIGRGQLVQFDDEASRVSVSDPAIADAVVVSPHDVVLNGKSVGHTTIMVWHGDYVS